MVASTLARPAAPNLHRPDRPDGTGTGARHGAAASLLITGDDRLADAVAPLAAAADHPLRRFSDPADALAHWQRAPLVLIGADAASACLDLGTPQRRDLIVCTTRAWAGADPGDTSLLWPLAIRLHAEHVIAVPEATDWLLDTFTRTVRDHTPAPVLAAVAGHGGAGASTFALAAATAAADDGRRTVLIDLDLDGGGIDTPAGLAEQAGWRWSSLAGLTGPLGPDRLLSGLPRRDGLHLIAPDPNERVDVATDTCNRILSAARFAADLVVIDLPRHRTGPAARAAAAADAVAVVLADSTRARTASRSVIADYGICTPRLGLLRRGAAGPEPAADAHDAAALPEWGPIPHDRRLPERLAHGRLPAGRAARRLRALTTALTTGAADRTGVSR